MKLFSKILMVTGLTWLVFLTLTTLNVLRSSYPLFLGLGLLTFIISICLIHFILKNDVKNEARVSQPLPLAPVERSIPIINENSGNFLTDIARSDVLTTLPNRLVFNEILNKAINHAKRRKQTLAVLLINIDSFKIFYETLGQENAEGILKEMARRFTSILRAEDMLAKLDGDEFIVLLTDINKPKFASTVAEKLLHACSQPLLIGSRDYFLTSSIGISIFPNDGDSLEAILKTAHAALYKAKHMGKGTYQFYTEALDTEAREYTQLGNALKTAISKNQLVLYYQPKIQIKTGNIVGIEALLRWEHPEHGLINPGVFIPLAEETGMMMQIGEWALREACKTNKYWQNEGYEHLSISINLSPKQFQHPKIVEVIENVLKETDLKPHYLELEITEKTVMENIESAKDILKKMKELGVKLSLDHFGTGYTSISHIKQFPIGVLKIDPNFIKGIPTSPDDIAITSALIGLAHHLGMEIVAQGVETAEQVQFLANEHCDIIQGYFLSHPQPAQSIILQFKKLGDKVLL